jgi:hypothetical protein
MPDHCKGFAEPFHFIDADSGPHVPDLHHAIATQGAQLGVFHRIEGYLFDARFVPFQLS